MLGDAEAYGVGDEGLVRAERAHTDVRLRIITREMSAGYRLDTAQIADEYGLSRDEARLVIAWLEDESLVVGAPGSYAVAPMSRDEALKAIALFAPLHRFLLERASVRLDPPARRLLESSADRLYSLGVRGEVSEMIELITACYGVCYTAAGAFEAEHSARMHWSSIIRIMLLVAPEFVSRAGLEGLVGHFKAVARGDAEQVQARLAVMWDRIEDAVVRAPDELWLASTDPS